MSHTVHIRLRIFWNIVIYQNISVFTNTFGNDQDALRTKKTTMILRKLKRKKSTKFRTEYIGEIFTFLPKKRLNRWYSVSFSASVCIITLLFFLLDILPIQRILPGHLQKPPRGWIQTRPANGIISWTSYALPLRKWNVSQRAKRIQHQWLSQPNCHDYYEKGDRKKRKTFNYLKPKLCNLFNHSILMIK